MIEKSHPLMLEHHVSQLNRHHTMIYIIGVVVCLIWEVLIGFVLATRAVDTLTLVVLLLAAAFQLVCLLAILFTSKSSLLTTMRIWCGSQLLLLALITINYIFGSQQLLMFKGIPPVALLGNHLLILLSFLLLDSLWAFRLTAASSAALMLAFGVHLSLSIQDYLNSYAVLWPVFIVFISNPLMIGILAAYQRIRDTTAMEFNHAMQLAEQQKRVAELDASRDPLSHLLNRKGILSELQELLDAHVLSGALILQVRGLHVARKNLPDVDYYALTKEIGLWMIQAGTQLGIRTGLVESGELMAWWSNEENLDPYEVAEDLIQDFASQAFAKRSDFELRGRAGATSVSELELQTPSVVLEELKFKLFLAESRGVDIVPQDAIR